MLRDETRARARALQLLYAWELRGRPPLEEVVRRLLAGGGRCFRAIEQAEVLAGDVIAELPRLDREIEQGAEHWRLERIGLIERNVLRIALYELLTDRVPARVAIDEALKLTHWFAGAKAPPFVNGILDGVARRIGRL
ncbi:MAG: transcription antitermination factor NusB [Gemmatimonadales bacterium]